ncbi:MAG TPA: methyl-accepting chemotaxis protein [Polyangiaceae bacterium]
MFIDAKIATKVVVGFIVALLVTVTIGIAGRQSLLKTAALMHDIADNRMPSASSVQGMVTAMNLVAAGQRGLVIRRMMEPKARQENFDAIAKGMRQLSEGRRAYEALPQDAAEARLWQRLAPSLDEWQRRVQNVVEIAHQKDGLLATGMKAGDPQLDQLDDKAFQALLQSRDSRLECERLLEEVAQINVQLAKNARDEGAATVAAGSSLILTVLLLGFGVVMAAAWAIARGVNSALSSLGHESQRLVDAAVSGQLSTRGELAAVPAEFRPIIQGVNDTLDAVIGPSNVAAEYVEKISQGDIPDRITTKYNGDFNAIKNNLNVLIESLSGFVAAMAHMSSEHDAGDIDVYVPEEQFRGSYRVMAKGVNDMVKGHIAVKKKAMACIAQFAAGNFDAALERFPGKKAFINENVEVLRRNCKALIDDAHFLSQAAVEGKLGTRADASKHQGDFKKIVEGVNDTLNAVIGPLNVAADYVDKISLGNIPKKITENYNGDFNTIKNNLNRCIDAVNELVVDAQMLSQAAIEGRLATRAEVTKHLGEFRKIVEGFNNTLDAVINPVMEATQVLESLSKYDLRARVVGEYCGDHARIKLALNGTAKTLHDALSQVADAVEQVSDASRQIASSSQSVAQGASEQASSLEETSSSLEEMSGMTKQNADNTIQARSLAQTTKVAAEKGGLAMGRMINAMEKIRTASEGTSQIIKDINEIAFQTNLLALNAAVEAARAGDAGRGFAVVAEEVRSLALRSKEAAKKTEELIKLSVGHAENGRIISGEVAGSLTEIVGAAGKVNEIVNEIAVASQEQSRGIDQVNTAVSEMDKVVQVAAANAEESSSAAEELSNQSEELTGLVGRFQLERDGNRRSIKRDATVPELRRRTSISVPVRRAPTAPQVRARNSNGNGSNATRKPAAEDVIPFDNDPDFKDF